MPKNTLFFYSVCLASITLSLINFFEIKQLKLNMISESSLVESNLDELRLELGKTDHRLLYIMQKQIEEAKQANESGVTE